MANILVQDQISKQELWGKQFTIVAKRVDKLDQEMDSRIIEVVTGLNMLGIPTSMSCEGHLDHGLVNPWVDIRLPAEIESGETSEKLTFKLRGQIEILVNEFNNKDTEGENEVLWIMDVEGTIGRIIVGPKEASDDINEISSRSLNSRQDVMRSFGKFLKQRYFAHQ